VTVLPADLIRPAAARDAGALFRLAALDSAAPLTGEILLAERDGALVAATSLADGRTIADPFRLTGPERAALQQRARALGGAAPSRSMRERFRSALAPRPAAVAG
jgi:hypothetical protein